MIVQLWSMHKNDAPNLAEPERIWRHFWKPSAMKISSRNQIKNVRMRNLCGVKYSIELNGNFDILKIIYLTKYQRLSGRGGGKKIRLLIFFMRVLGKDVSLFRVRLIYLKVFKSVNCILLIFIIHSIKATLSKFFYFYSSRCQNQSRNNP